MTRRLLVWFRLFPKHQQNTEFPFSSASSAKFLAGVACVSVTCVHEIGRPGFFCFLCSSSGSFLERVTDSATSYITRQLCPAHFRIQFSQTIWKPLLSVFSDLLRPLPPLPRLQLSLVYVVQVSSWPFFHFHYSKMWSPLSFGRVVAQADRLSWWTDHRRTRVLGAFGFTCPANCSAQWLCFALFSDQLSTLNLFFGFSPLSSRPTAISSLFCVKFFWFAV